MAKKLDLMLGFRLYLGILGDELTKNNYSSHRISLSSDELTESHRLAILVGDFELIGFMQCLVSEECRVR